jgi:hypothetical protein
MLWYAYRSWLAGDKAMRTIAFEQSETFYLSYFGSTTPTPCHSGRSLMQLFINKVNPWMILIDHQPIRGSI